MRSLAAAGGDGVHLQPGMHAELFIKTSERTVLDYLLEPVAATLPGGYCASAKGAVWRAVRARLFAPARMPACPH